MQRFNTIDEYIDSFSQDKKSILEQFRKTIKALVPDASEAISYGMPTFKLYGKNLVHFAAFKSHIGFFPTPSGIDALDRESKPYRTGKGTMQFALGNPIPWDLVEKIVMLRVKELEGTK